MTTKPETLSPVPVGTKVAYHGSIDYRHGEYRVTGHQGPGDHPCYTDETAARYSDGVAYDLYPVGTDPKFGNRGSALFFVRRASITVVAAS